VKRCVRQVPQAVVPGKRHLRQSGTPSSSSTHRDKPGMKFRRYVAAAALCLMPQLSWSPILRAQNSATSTITGTVTDPAGSVIASADVTVLNEATHVSVTVKTSNSGDYNAPFLQPGSYQVTVTRTGFETFEQARVDLLLDQTVRVDAQLKVGRSSEVVSVSTDSVSLETESSQLELNFSNELVENLPVEGRFLEVLDQLAPGVSTAMAQHVGSDELNTDERMDVQGSRAFTTNAILNGGNVVLPNSDNFDTHIPALAAVKEFSIVTNNFGAQYGLGSWVLNVITKSGTNQFHGTGLEYLENAALNATPGFSTSKPRSVYNQFGGAIGGPVLRNRLFFFFSFEDTTNPSSSHTIVTVPTADMIAGNFTQFSTPIIDPTTGEQFDYNGVPNTINPGRFDAIAKNVLKYWPTPNYGGPNATSNNYFRLAPLSPKYPIYDYKVDWAINSAHELSVSGHNHRQTIAYTGEIPGPACYNTEDCGSSGQYDDNYQIAERWIINPHMVNAFNVGILREFYWNYSPTFGQDYPTKLGFPNSNIAPYMFPVFYMTTGIQTSIGGGANGAGIQNAFVYGDILTWLKGSHSLSIGGEFSKFQVNNPPSWGDPSFTFNGQYTGNGFADFLLGDVQSYAYNATLVELGERRPSAAAFVQDDWKITHGLTLNLGLRWQFEGGWYEAHGIDSNFSPTAINPATNTPGAIVFANSNHWLLQQSHPGLFAPHLGFAKTIGSRNVLRAGFGLFYQRTNGEDLTNGGPPGFSTSQTLIANTVTTPPVFQLDNGPPPYSIPTASSRTADISNGQGITWWPYNSHQSFSTQYHLSFERQLGTQTTAQISYVGAQGRHLLDTIDSNQVPLSELGTPTDQTDPQLLRPFPQYQSIGTWVSTTSSRYNALEIELQRRMSRGFSLLTNYTHAKSVDQSSLDLSTWIGDDSQNQQDLPMTPSAFNEPDRFVAAYVYDLPFGKGRMLANQGGALDEIVGGWSTSGSFNIHSGYPTTIYSGLPNRTGSLAGGVFANRVADQPSPKTRAEWFNPANFGDPVPYTYGNSGRDSTMVPGYWNLDANIQKHFTITESVKMLLRADAFNFFNHKNLGEPGETIDLPNTGVIASSTEARIIEVGTQIDF
jgi:carboxypeptidase family protein